eukprot:5349919-Prymnesium_polylepis.2
MFAERGSAISSTCGRNSGAAEAMKRAADSHSFLKPSARQPSTPRALPRRTRSSRVASLKGGARSTASPVAAVCHGNLRDSDVTAVTVVTVVCPVNLGGVGSWERRTRDRRLRRGKEW